jgi:hypothetical protein
MADRATWDAETLVFASLDSLLRYANWVGVEVPQMDDREPLFKYKERLAFKIADAEYRGKLKR